MSDEIVSPSVDIDWQPADIVVRYDPQCQVVTHTRGGEIIKEFYLNESSAEEDR
jgi:hypothetical protein